MLSSYSISPEDIAPFLIFAGLVMFGVRGFAWNYLKRLQARSWMTNHGRIELVNVELRHISRHTRYYMARLDYSYSVNGEYYSGFMERCSSGRSPPTNSPKP
jgi:hypothetical protein